MELAVFFAAPIPLLIGCSTDFHPKACTPDAECGEALRGLTKDSHNSISFFE